MMDLPVCNACQDEDKPSLSKIPGEGWLCDECIADIETYDQFSETFEENKRKKLSQNSES
jgi:hypothetical protein